MKKKGLALINDIVLCDSIHVCVCSASAPADQGTPPGPGYGTWGTRRKVWLRTGIRDGAWIWTRSRTGDDGPGFYLWLWHPAMRAVILS